MTALLGPSHIAMVAKGVSAIVASRDAALRPSIMRAVGSHISGNGREVTVYLRRSQSEQLLQDIAHTGEIAVVFSVPSTHQTLQLKARRATQRPATDGDLPVLQAYLQSMVQEVGRAVLVRMVRTCADVSAAFRDFISAMTPVTWGAAIEVPAQWR